MAVLSDTTVTGAGDLAGYNPAPLTLYAIVTQLGNARTHDTGLPARWFDLGFVSPYFDLDPVGLGTESYKFQVIFIEWERAGISLHEFTGGLDGIHYSLGPGVEVRFVLTDD